MNNTNLLKTGFVNERFRYYEKLVAELTMMSDMFMRNVLNILEERLQEFTGKIGCT